MDIQVSRVDHLLLPVLLDLDMLWASFSFNLCSLYCFLLLLLYL